MSDVLPVPVAEMKRVAAANSEVVAAARRLIEIASQTPDPKVAEDLLLNIRQILASSNAISGAVRTAGYLRAARGG